MTNALGQPDQHRLGPARAHLRGGQRLRLVQSRDRPGGADDPLGPRRRRRHRRHRGLPHLRRVACLGSACACSPTTPAARSASKRRGLVLGEGAGIFVLRRWSTRSARGATILAELAGSGMTADATDIVMPERRGRRRRDAPGASTMPASRRRTSTTSMPTAPAPQANDRTETPRDPAVFGAHADAPRGVLDQVDARPRARRRRRDRAGRGDRRAARRRGAADGESRPGRSGLRSGLRAEHRRGRCRCVPH